MTKSFRFVGALVSGALLASCAVEPEGALDLAEGQQAIVEADAGVPLPPPAPGTTPAWAPSPCDTQNDWVATAPITVDVRTVVPECNQSGNGCNVLEYYPAQSFGKVYAPSLATHSYVGWWFDDTISARSRAITMGVRVLDHLRLRFAGECAAIGGVACTAGQPYGFWSDTYTHHYGPHVHNPTQYWSCRRAPYVPPPTAPSTPPVLITGPPGSDLALASSTESVIATIAIQACARVQRAAGSFAIAACQTGADALCRAFPGATELFVARCIRDTYTICALCVAAGALK